MSETENTPEVDVDLNNVETFARSNPSSLPPQFKGDPDKFIKSWKDMRSEITKLQQAKKSTPPEIESQDRLPEKEVSTPNDLNIPEKPTQLSEDEWNKWGMEISSTGNLSQDTKAAIKARFGIPDQILDTYVDGIRARQRQLATEAAGVVGGPEELNKIIQWATDNLQEDEREAVNTSLKQPGWQNVLLGLKARKNMNNTEPKSRIVGSSGVPSGLKPFSNSREMVNAMRDPRYKYDTEYQTMVQERTRLTGVMKND